MTETSKLPLFSELNLPEPILQAIVDQGYEQPSPIQAESIPSLLAGRDLLGQAQTGTGKTAAFALPLLSKLDPKSSATQLLILAPTRELAIQVAEACQQYAKHLKGINVLPIYGGQSYTIQLKQLSRGAQVVVGTPGRVMDHMRRKTLSLDGLKALVLDEADEMLRMGFIDDVKWVLEQSPPTRQIALFSATMPREVKKVADQHLQDPVHIKIASKTVTAANIKQRYWIVRGTNKLDAITRILESEETEGVIVFVRTKTATVELADKLSARGFRSEALNGDIPQANREKIIDRLRGGKLDLLIATDVVARGLDVERISHVINYDVPHDTESYIHRIGRTGRAGRSGQAILFVAPREKRMLFSIERATNQPITPMELPSVADINRNRVERFKQRIVEAVGSDDIDFFSQLITELQHDQEISIEQIAAAAAFLAQGDTSLILDEAVLKREKAHSSAFDRSGDDRPFERRERRERGDRRSEDKPVPKVQPTPLKDFPDVKMQRFRLSVGRRNQVKPGNIVGAIANEAELESKYIGEIEIREEYSTVDLPADMPKAVLAILKRARVAGRPLEIMPFTGDEAPASRSTPQAARPEKKRYTSKKGAGSKSGGVSDYAKKKRKDRKNG
ncbi:DEAD/DEAH box helicase [Arenicella xantha]|uniref:ATP-dependent RNA helicase DeaD n=1 Tax=Arenicella xantha TaxID=644221 RepID=A0A395JL99_9GAMM|nr:DEAD/DEAH box helicase [Arenicella xantha]RBP51566.1 ATP-dependent RNA helicase CsdA [Arenicella xantha]